MKNIGLRYGLITGAVVVTCFVVLYLISKELMLSPLAQWLSFIPFIAGMVLAARQEKRTFEGVYNLQAAFKTTFTVYVVAAVLYYVFYFILFRYADPGLVDVQKEMIEKMLEERASLMGEDVAEDVRQRFESEGIEVTFTNTALALARSILGGGIIALLVALVQKD